MLLYGDSIHDFCDAECCDCPEQDCDCSDCPACRPDW
jgi:hypothetical protein